jgi:hypothetical protein
MVGLVTVRYHIPPGAKIDFEGILDYKMNVMPGLLWKDGKWSKYTTDNIEHSTSVRDMAVYADYTDGVHSDPADYDIGKDIFGTQYFMPFQCIKQTSVTIPRRTSPGIAIIGETKDTADITEKLVNYFKALFQLQIEDVAALRLLLPKYKKMSFATE